MVSFAMAEPATPSTQAKPPGRNSISPFHLFEGATGQVDTLSKCTERRAVVRIQFSDIERPKAAAKQLVRVNPSLKLAAAQEALARATGYRDWHELAASLHSDNDGTTDLHEAPMVALIHQLANDLGMRFGDVQYALTKARFLEILLPLKLQLSLRARALREYVFEPPGRGKPGTVVKSKARSLGGSVKPGSQGYLLPKNAYSRGGVRVLFNNGICSLADFEVQTPRLPIPDFLPARFWLPYGCWTLEDGAVVPYSRDYFPLWHIDPNGKITRPEPWYWINGIKQNLYFPESCETPGIWSHGPSHAAAIQFLGDRRVLGLPRLVEAFPLMFEAGVESAKDAIIKLQSKVQQHGEIPKYAKERKNMAWA